MAKKKKKEVNLGELAADELERELEKNQASLFKLRFRAASAGLNNVMEIRQLRRDIARINTFILQKRNAN